MNPIVKKIIPFVVAFLTFYGISALFFISETKDGLVLQQVDTQQVNAMNREAREYSAKTGEAIQWTNTIFGGMPTTMIYQKNKGNLLRHVYYGSMLWKDMKSPSIELFLVMMMMFLALLLLGIDWRISLLAGLGYGFGTYNMELLEAGHATKMVAIAYFGLIASAAWHAYNRNILLGGAIFAVALAMQVYSTHYQIVYYTLLVVVLLGIVEFIKAIKQKTLGNFAKATGLMIAFGLLCAATNTSKLWTTYDYSKETIRGTSDLAAKKDKDGLGKDYVFSWSYGIGESLTLLVPDYMGGGSSQSYKGTSIYKKIAPNIKANLAKNGITGKSADHQVNAQIASLFYRGDQAFVGMGVYMGIVFFFLMVLGIILGRGALKWWLLASLITLLTIAWGKNFPLNHIWYNVLPLFNKFRSLSMALSLFQGAAVMLGAIGLQAFFSKQTSIKQKTKAFKLAAGITLGALVLIFLSSFIIDFSSPKDERVGPELAKLLEADRLSLLRKDVGRSLLFAVLGMSALYLYLKNQITAVISTILLILFSLVDMWSVGRRIINTSKFKKPIKSATIHETQADKQIKQDPDIHYRVLDLTKGDPFTNASGALSHKMVGGYHAAKLMRYNDVIDKYLRQPGKYINILGMLNTKYIIQNQGNQAVPIPLKDQALGNAWFVPSYRILDDADKELEALGSLNPRQEAIFDKAYASELNGFTIDYDSTATIKLAKYHPDKMEYVYSAKTPQLVVFSEVYYPESKGWTITVNDQRVPLLKANYLLRAAVLPAGQNQKLVMKFHPKAYYLGEKISFFASLALLLALIAGFYFSFRKKAEDSSLYSLSGKIGETSTSTKDMQPKTTTTVKKKQSDLKQNKGKKRK